MFNPFLVEFRCAVCGKTYTPENVTYTCPACGLVGVLDAVYDFDRLRGAVSRASIGESHEQTMWRYRALLPLANDAQTPPLPVGGTPLIAAPRLAESFNMGEVRLKDDGRNPTGSLKDRASALVVARAMQIGASTVTTASTGNAAAALAGLAASAGLRAVIFVPATAPEAKIAQLLVYGATVFLVQGTYDQAFDLCVTAAERYGWYCRNTAMNPFTVEGKKTVSFEIAEQLGWRAPDAVIVSVGDGNILAGVHKGFADLATLGWIDHVPKLIGVQAEGSAALYQAWQRGSDGTDVAPINAQTIADSIAADLPRDRVRAMRAIRETGGEFITVSDAEIDAAILQLARTTGVFAEPAAATSLAGLKMARTSGLIAPEMRVVLLITGSGLKDVRGAMRAVTSAKGSGYPISPDGSDLAEAVKRLGL